MSLSKASLIILCFLLVPTASHARGGAALPTTAASAVDALATTAIASLPVARATRGDRTIENFDSPLNWPSISLSSHRIPKVAAGDTSPGNPVTLPSRVGR